jgi:hypothetical protein
VLVSSQTSDLLPVDEAWVFNKAGTDSWQQWQIHLTSLLARPGGELADQVFVRIVQHIHLRGKLGQPLGDLLDDGAELGVSIRVGLAQLRRGEVDAREQVLERVLEGFRLDVLEARLERVQQLRVLGAGHVGDAGPEVRRLDDVMHLAPHLPLELRDVVDVVRIPQCQRHLAGVAAHIRVILAQLLLRGRLVVVREIAEEEEGQHVVAEIIRIHRPAQLVGDAPEGVAQLLLVGVGHRKNLPWLRSSSLLIWQLPSLPNSLPPQLGLNRQGFLDSCCLGQASDPIRRENQFVHSSGGGFGRRPACFSSFRVCTAK